MSNLTPRQKELKSARKESLLYKTVLDALLQISLDNSEIKDIFVSKVKLSSDKSVCWIYFYSQKGEEHFKKILDILKLYKPSIRTSIAKNVPGRYTPDIIFKFDRQFEKQETINKILDRLKKEGQL